MFNTAIWLACTDKTTRSIIVYFEWSPPVPLKNYARSIDLESCLLRLTKLTPLSSSRVKFDPYLNIYVLNDLPILYFCILCIIVHLSLFLSPDWLTFYHMIIPSEIYIYFTRFFIYFLFLSDEGPTLETLDYILSVLAVHTDLFIFRNIYINFVFLPYEVPFLDR